MENTTTLNLLVCPKIPYILPVSDKKRHYSDNDLLAMLQSINRDVVKRAEFNKRNDGDDNYEILLREAVEKESVEILHRPLHEEGFDNETVKDLFMREFEYFDENAFQARYYDDTVLQQVLDFMNQTVNLRELFIDFLYSNYCNCEWDFNAWICNKKDELAAVIRSGKVESFDESDNRLRSAFVVLCINWNKYNAGDRYAKSISDHCTKPLDKAKDQAKSLREQAASLMKQALQVEKLALKIFLRDANLDGKVMYYKHSGKLTITEVNGQNVLYFEPDERDYDFEYYYCTIAKGEDVLNHHFELSDFVRRAVPLKDE